VKCISKTAELQIINDVDFRKKIKPILGKDCERIIMSIIQDKAKTV